MNLETLNNYIVTERAKRPASDKDECFYCNQPIGSPHKFDCVLIHKKARVRMTVDYEVEVPNHWGRHDIEFHRNEGTWCADNALRELGDVARQVGCLCAVTTFEYLEDASDPYLDER